MSTILKALRRLDREKAQQADRPLREEVVAVAPGEPLVRRTRRARLALLAAAAAAAGIALLSALGVPRGLRVELPAQWLGAEPSAASVPRRAVGSELVSTPEPSAPSAARAPTAASAPVRVERGAEVGPSEPREMGAEPEVAFAAIPRRPSAARSPAPRDAPRAMPDLSTLSTPELVVQRTFWHPEPAKRSALVAMAGRDGLLRLREGDVVGPLVLVVIEPSGVVFMRDGELIQERVGASR